MSQVERLFNYLQEKFEDKNNISLYNLAEV